MTNEDGEVFSEQNDVSMPDDMTDEVSVGTPDGDAVYAESAFDPYDRMAEVDPEGAEALREEWGNEFDANLAFARAAVDTLADTALIELLEESGLGDDPRIVRVAARIGRALQSANGDGDGRYRANDQTALEAALEELTASPDYWSDRVQKQVRQINLALYGSEPIAVHRTTGDAGGVGADRARSPR